MRLDAHTMRAATTGRRRFRRELRRLGMDLSVLRNEATCQRFLREPLLTDEEADNSYDQIAWFHWYCLQRFRASLHDPRALNRWQDLLVWALEEWAPKMDQATACQVAEDLREILLLLIREYEVGSRGLVGSIIYLTRSASLLCERKVELSGCKWGWESIVETVRLMSSPSFPEDTLTEPLVVDVRTLHPELFPLDPVAGLLLALEYHDYMQGTPWWGYDHRFDYERVIFRSTHQIFGRLDAGCRKGIVGEILGQ